MFHILFSSHSDRAFQHVPQEIRQHIMDKLESLATDDFWYRRVKKLHGVEDQYRLRIGRWRILFSLTDNKLEILDIFMKKGKEDYRRHIA